MIYKISGYNSLPTYYVDQDTHDNHTDFKIGVLIVGTLDDANAALLNIRKQILENEATRFSVCATFTDGDHSIWRLVIDPDPEDTECQVFNTFTGKYDYYTTKTEAIAANESLKNDFLKQHGLDEVKILDGLPT